MAKKDWDKGRRDWRDNGRLSEKALLGEGSEDYRRGAQAQRTDQVDRELRAWAKNR